MAIAEALLTADEFLLLPDNGRPTELVRGKPVEMNMPNPRHGEVCLQVGHLLKLYLQEHPIGRAVSNDSGIVTRRDPDTVRGADVAFYSYEDVPRQPLPKKYTEKPPRLVFEILSPSELWKDVLQKVAEYLTAGVLVVCVLDPEEEKAYVYHAEKPEQILTADEDWSVPAILPDWCVPVKRFFE